jgi:hypothetical protein
MAEHLPLGDDVFGFAVVLSEPGSSLLASVFYHRIRTLADDLGYSRSEALGYIMAHEIGHLLLPSGAHSPSGIILARLTREDLLRSLRFTRAQAQLMIAELGSVRKSRRL